MENTQVQSVNYSDNYNEVWAILQENAKQMKKSEEDFEKQSKKYDKQINDLNKRFGEFSNRFGEVVEYMIAPNLREKFKEFGLIFPQACSNKDVSDYENNIFFEVDVMLEDGDKAMLVEIKTNLLKKDVDEHIERLEKMRKYADLRGDKRNFLGSVAGVIIKKNIKDYALNKGFFVVEPSGEDFHITAPQGKPKKW